MLDLQYRRTDQAMLGYLKVAAYECELVNLGAIPVPVRSSFRFMAISCELTTQGPNSGLVLLKQQYCLQGMR